MIELIKKYCQEAKTKIETVHIDCFKNYDKPLFLISEAYPGIWLEHIYDSIMYATMYPEYIKIAENTVRIFFEYQKKDGQLPCYIWDAGRLPDVPEKDLIGYGQIQECVSFAKLCLTLYRLNNNKDLLKDSYYACEKWEQWLRNNRMTTNRGLPEMFVGYDTGHDCSGRLDGLAHPGNSGKNAAVLPDYDGITPVIAVDMSCNYFATLTALSEMAEILGEQEESQKYKRMAAEAKKAIFKNCYDKEDGFFYDADRNGNFRKIKSSTIFHLFLEGVLNYDKDKELIESIYKNYIKNPTEFYTSFPFPSVSVSDKSWLPHKKPNSWGYYSQALIALRCTMWMDKYGFNEDFDYVCKKWLEGLTKNHGTVPFGQELDPITGEASSSSKYYSSSMIFYLYSAKRIHNI